MVLIVFLEGRCLGGDLDVWRMDREWGIKSREIWFMA